MTEQITLSFVVGADVGTEDGVAIVGADENEGAGVGVNVGA